MQPWYEVPSQAWVYVICEMQRNARSLLLTVYLQPVLQPLQSRLSCCRCTFLLDELHCHKHKELLRKG